MRMPAIGAVGCIESTHRTHKPDPITPTAPGVSRLDELKALNKGLVDLRETMASVVGDRDSQEVSLTAAC